MTVIQRHHLSHAVFWLISYLLLTSIFYGSTLAAWWCCDDPQILKHALRYSPWEYFAVPEAWRALVPYSLTPWLSLTYDLDHALFGLKPLGYYVHNLLIITLCAWLICLLARQWVPSRYAFGGGVLFLLGVPVMVAAHQLMVRHYMEGLLFYLLALLWLVRAFKGQERRFGRLAGIAFAVAATAKEIYLPLGLIPFLLPLGDFRHRLKSGRPLLLVMLLYVPWRWYMLGDPVGGYTPVTALGRDDVLSALGQFTNIPALLLAWPWLPLSAVALCIGLVIRRTRQWWLPLLLVFLALALLAPLIPLARHPGIGAGSERYFIALWAALAVGSALLAGFIAAGRGMRYHLFSGVLLAVLCCSAWQQAEKVRATLLPHLQEQSVQGKALITAGEGDSIYLTPAVAAWYVSGIIDLQQEFGRSLHSPHIILDEIDLYRQPLLGRRVLRYDPATQTMVDRTSSVPQILGAWHAKIQPRLLAITMEFNPAIKTLHWQLGPYSQGQYTLLSEFGRQPLPQQGSLRMEKPTESIFRFRYDAPEGWIAYTPQLRFVTTPQGISRLVMQGPGLKPGELMRKLD